MISAPSCYDSDRLIVRHEGVSVQVKSPRQEARNQILVAATKASHRPGFTYRVRHLHEAVAACRSRRLISDDVIVAAGFRAGR